MTDPVLIDLPTAIDTPRLLLRPPRPGDGAPLHAAIVESLPALRQFLASLPWVAAEQTVESAETWCRTSHANFLARRDLPFLVFDKATGALVGAPACTGRCGRRRARRSGTGPACRAGGRAS